MSKSCGDCNLKIKRDVSSCLCSDCKVLFHGTCVNLKSRDLDFLVSQGALWCCNTCKLKKKRERLANIDTTPIKTISTNENNQLETAIVENPSNDVLYKKLLDIERYNVSLNSKITTLSADLNNILNRVDTIFDTVESLKSSISKNEDDIIQLQDQINTNNTLHNNNLIAVNKRIDFFEKQYLKNNIELHGVPVTENENIKNIVLKILNESLGTSVNVNEIDFCYRKVKNKNNVNNDNSPDKSIIFVRFFSSYICQLILNKKNAKKNKNFIKYYY